MTDNSADIHTHLTTLGLGTDEATIYLKLLEKPSTHLRLSRETGINRTKVYRIIEQLEARSLVTRRSDDRGVFLAASDPATLEVALVSQEEKLQRKRASLNRVLPVLHQLQGHDSKDFIVRTYEGQAGLKQMCWHELKAKGELLGLGNGAVEQIVNDERWAEKHRERQIAGGYTVRELINVAYGEELPDLAAERLLTSGLYVYRILSPEILQLGDNQTIIYNNTVSIYHWRDEQQIGVEVTNAAYARMMRQIFNHYWTIAQVPRLV